MIGEALRRSPAGHRIYLAGCAGEPTATLDALQADPELGAGRRFTGVWIPGVNRRDPIAGVRDASADVFFMTPALRDGFARGSVRHHPLGYSAIWARLSRLAPTTTAFVSVAPPKDGRVGLGPTADFTPALVAGGARLVGEINPNLPQPVHAITVPVERFDALIEAPAAPLGYDAGTIDPVVATIAETVAGLIDDGDTVQFGLGKMQAATLPRLAGHRGLGFHGGMMSTPILAPLEAGVFAKGLVTGVALGSADFYERVAARPDIRFAPVSHTHNAAVLAQTERLVSVASALEVDLYGQVNAEMVGGRQVSGNGGIAEFARGAMASRGGRSIVALPSTAGKGTRSRIVVTLSPEAVCSIARSDIDVVVTEHGVARLREADIDSRARALIDIASPGFRDMLASQWDKLRAGL